MSWVPVTATCFALNVTVNLTEKRFMTDANVASVSTDEKTCPPTLSVLECSTNANSQVRRWYVMRGEYVLQEKATEQEAREWMERTGKAQVADQKASPR